MEISGSLAHRQGSRHLLADDRSSVHGPMLGATLHAGEVQIKQWGRIGGLASLSSALRRQTLFARVIELTTTETLVPHRARDHEGI